MTALDDEIGPLAADVIGEFGKSVTLVRVTAGAYNPTTSASTNTESSETVKAIVEDYKPYELVNGLAVAGDKKLTVAASGLSQPQLTDAIVIDGVRFSIVTLQTINSGEDAALYILQGRKS